MNKAPHTSNDPETNLEKLYNLKECSVLIHKLPKAQHGCSLRSPSLSDKYENTESGGRSDNATINSDQCMPKHKKTVDFETTILHRRYEKHNSAIYNHSSDRIKTYFEDPNLSQNITKDTFRDTKDITALSQNQLSITSKHPSKIKSFYEYESFRTNLSKITPKTHNQSQEHCSNEGLDCLGQADIVLIKVLIGSVTRTLF